jgi:hypothetical protein
VEIKTLKQVQGDGVAFEAMRLCYLKHHHAELVSASYFVHLRPREAPQGKLARLGKVIT